MDKRLLFNWLLRDLSQNVEKYCTRVIEEHQGSLSLEDKLCEANSWREVVLPDSLPRTPDKMLPILREHFRDNVTFISLVLNHHFPERYLYYRFSILEREIFEGLAFFSDIIPEFSLPFPGIGAKGVDRYLQLNEQMMRFMKQYWLKAGDPTPQISYLLYEGLGRLFLEKSEYNRYWLMVAKADSFDELDKSDRSFWSARKEMRRGDLVFMYRMTPRKAIADIWRVADEPWFDPWAGWLRFWVDIEKVCHIPDITFAQMRQDAIIGNWGIIKRNLFGTVTEPVPHAVYNRLLEYIPEHTRQKHGLKPEPVPPDGPGDEQYFTSEAEFEEKVVQPLLKALGFRYTAQYPCRFCVGSQYHDCRVDFMVEDQAGPLTLFEDKFRIPNEQLDLPPARDQAKSYALMLGLPSFVVGSLDGFWVYSLRSNKETPVAKFSAQDLGDLSRRDEFRKLLLTLRR
jgi:hypothetical protein